MDFNPENDSHLKELEKEYEDALKRENGEEPKEKPEDDDDADSTDADNSKETSDEESAGDGDTEKRGQDDTDEAKNGDAKGKDARPERVAFLERELKRLKKANEDRDLELERLRTAQHTVPQEQNVGQEQHDVDPDIIAIKRERLVKQAEDELDEEIRAYEKVNPDVVEAMTWHVGKIYNALRELNPELTHTQAVQRSKEITLARAGKAVNRGENPAEALFQEAVSKGWEKSKPKETTVKQDPKPNLTSVEKAKKRSASGLQSSGAGDGEVTIDFALNNMTNEQIARLKPEQWAAIERQTRQG